MQWYWIIAAALVIVSTVMHWLGILRFETSLHWSAWVVGALVLLNGGWMAFDGGRALVIGDYVTPKTGQLAGTLGPWSRVVEAAGIDPRSTLMKSMFLTYGLTYLGATAAFLLGTSSGPRLTGCTLFGSFHEPDRHTAASATPSEFLPHRDFRSNGHYFPHIMIRNGTTPTVTLIVTAYTSAWWAILFLALLGCWYIPFGTSINLIVLTLLLLPPLRSVGGNA